MLSHGTYSVCLLFLLFFLQPLHADHGGWDCVHSKIQETETIPAPQKYSKALPEVNGIAQRRTGHQPVRMYFEVSQLSEDLNGDAAKIAYVNKVLEGARQRLQQVVSVLPVEGNLFVARRCNVYWSNGPNEGFCAEESRNSCGTQNFIPEDHLNEMTVFYDATRSVTYAQGDGIPDTDIVLYVTANDVSGVCSNNAALAYADSCQRDQNDRPTAGFINFCQEQLDSDGEEASNDDVLLAIHEIVHVLGMASSSYPFYRDADGNPRTPRCPAAAESMGGICSFRSGLENAPPRDRDGIYMVDPSVVQVEIKEDGSQVQRVVTPAVTARAQQHFACDDLQGAELEDDGGAGTMTSHWEKRVYFTEFMTGSRQSASDSVISAITLALLEDTGWYEVNYEAADQFKWGREQGCAFVSDACPSWNCSADASSAEQTCTFDRSGVGYCGVDPLMDDCPVVLPYTNQRCNDAEQQSQARCGDQDCVGSYFGAGSACMATTLVLDSFALPGPELRVSCYRHRCSTDDSGADVLEVQTPDGTWHECEPNKVLRTSGFEGAVICPTTSELCGDFALGNLGEVVIPGGGGGGWPNWATYLLFSIGMVVVLLVTAYLIQRNCYREDEPAQDRYDSPYGPQPVSPSHGGVVIDASLGYDYQAGSRQQSGFSGLGGRAGASGLSSTGAPDLSSPAMVPVPTSMPGMFRMVSSASVGASDPTSPSNQRAVFADTGFTPPGFPAMRQDSFAHRPGYGPGSFRQQPQPASFRIPASQQGSFAQLPGLVRMPSSGSGVVGSAPGP